MKKNYFLAVLMAISWGAFSQTTAVQFDGVNDIAEINIGYAPVPIDPESFTIEAIIKPGQTGNNMVLFHSYHAQGSIEFGIDANMNPYFSYLEEDAALVAEDIEVLPFECQHIAVSVREHEVVFYHNGHPYTHIPLNGSVAFPNQRKFYLGGRSPGQSLYSGVIDEFRIWPEERSDAEILQYAFETPETSQWPIFLLLTFWEGAGVVTSDYFMGIVNYALFVGSDTNPIDWVEPCIELIDFSQLAERFGTDPMPCVPDPNRPNNLICNGGFEQYDPILQTNPSPLPAALVPDAFGYSDIAAWEGVSGIAIRNFPHAFPLPNFNFANNPNTWDWPPATGNDVMFFTYNSWVSYDPQSRPYVKNKLNGTVAPGVDYEFSGWFYVSHFLAGSTASTFVLDLELRSSSNTSLSYTAIPTYTLVHHGSLPGNGWQYVTINFTLPAGTPNVYDELVVAFEPTVSASFSDMPIVFFDDLALEPTCTGCFQNYMNAVGGGNDSWHRRVKVDANDNIYVLGKLSLNSPSPVLGIGLPVSQTLTGIDHVWSSFVAKYSPTGSLLWVQRHNYVQLHDFEILPNGNVMVVGNTQALDTSFTTGLPWVNYIQNFPFSACGTTMNAWHTEQLLIGEINPSNGNFNYANAYGGSGSESGIGIQLVGNKALIACIIKGATYCQGGSQNSGISWAGLNRDTDRILELDFTTGTQSGISSLMPNGQLRFISAQGNDLYVLSANGLAKLDAGANNSPVVQSVTLTVPTTGGPYIYSRSVYAAANGRVFVTYDGHGMELFDASNLAHVDFGNERIHVTGNGNNIYAIGENNGNFLIEKLDMDPMVPFGTTIWQEETSGSNSFFFHGLSPHEYLQADIIPMNGGNKLAYIGNFSTTAANWTLNFGTKTMAANNGPLHANIFIGTLMDQGIVGTFKTMGEGLQASFNEGLAIYPNPAGHMVNLVSGQPVTGVRVLNLQGKAVIIPELERTNPDRLTFTVENLPKGMYLVEVYCNEKRYVEKLVVQ